MLTEIERRLLCAIVQYLKSFTLDDQRPSMDSKKESIEVAVQILRSVFDIPAQDTVATSDAQSLLTIFQQAVEAAKGSADPEAASKAEALKNEGNNLMSFSRFEEAVQKYTDAIALVRSPIYYCNRAAAFSKLNKHQEALNDCQAALEMNPNYNKAYGRMGLAYYNLEKYAEAVTTYKKAYELDPNNETFLCNMRLAEAKLAEQRAAAGGAGPQPAADPGQPDGTRNIWPALASMMNSPGFVRTVQALSELPAVQNMLETFSRDLVTGASGNNQVLPEVVNMVDRLARSFDFNADTLNNLAGQMNANAPNNGATTNNNPGNNSTNNTNSNTTNNNNNAAAADGGMKKPPDGSSGGVKKEEEDD